MEVNYVDIHCRLISEGFVCGERLHAFRLPLQPTAKPRCSGGTAVHLVLTLPLCSSITVTAPHRTACISTESEPELPPPSIFSVETSIFAPRKHEVDSGDYFDNSKVHRELATATTVLKQPHRVSWCLVLSGLLTLFVARLEIKQCARTAEL